jgi:HAMP domain-containing protein
VTTSIESALGRGEQLGNHIAAAIAVIAALLTGIAFVFGRSVSKPLLAMSTAMRRLAQGDLSVAIPAGKRRDEIGQMAKSLEVFKGHAEAVAEAAAEREKLENPRRGRTRSACSRPSARTSTARSAASSGPSAPQRKSCAPLPNG